MNAPNSKLPTYSIIDNGTYYFLYFDDVVN